MGLAAMPRPAFPAAGPHHDLVVSLYPTEHRIEVRDTITLPEPRQVEEVRFLLHRSLQPSVVGAGGAPAPAGKMSGSGAPDEVPAGAERYQVRLPPGARSFSLVYGGQIYDPLSAEQDYARGFRETSGLVAEEGVYLSGQTLWVPRIEGAEDLITFSLDVRLPPGWDAVSQGGRTVHERSAQGSRVRWEAVGPQDEVFLVAGPFHGYTRPTPREEVEVFLREPDEALAGKYLETGARYLEMYSRLLGPYPYPKFALVENFWDTGYGMPSFTLLGSRIIRFPFILHSSYPHEILHNWWGNGVYVDYAEGNWCEGLTAYLADHLIQEGRGAGAEYRQTTLQKYADYAARGRDFPLREFRSRHSSATEAVGYGKSLMFFHMLRRSLGDEIFVRGLQSFYRTHLFRAASFDDLRRALEVASGKDLQAEFSQWVDRTGAPLLAVTRASAEPTGDGWRLRLDLAQRQEGPAYRLRVPVAVTLEGEEGAREETVAMSEGSSSAEFTVPSRPLRVDVDPEFDLFRRLDAAEIPPALSGAFGAERVLVVLPADAKPALRVAYRELGESWARSQPGAWDLAEDRELSALPRDRAVWLFGWENRFLPAFADAVRPYGATVEREAAAWGATKVARGDRSVVLVGRHPADVSLTLALVATENAAALPGLGRKLPHYHKYSYLAFEGDEPTNTDKGRWPVVDSPLTVVLAGGEGAARAALPPRKPLASLAPAFSAERMLRDVRALAADELEGRGFGSPGLDRTAELLARTFRDAGLAPGARGGSYFQEWQARGGEPESEATLRNVVGVLPGTRPEWADQSVVVGAHYDHLGRGWPDVRAGERGRVHPGADDNASGVAVLLELARALAGEWRPERSVVFVAFAGEEAGRLGSRHYVAAGGAHPAAQALGMINLDTVGRLGSGKLFVLGAESAREWVHIFNGASFVTGVPVEVVPQEAGGSDQASFLEAGVPAVQLFTGPHGDYHRPTDTADRVDGEGLVKVASVAQQALEYLAARAEPLTSEGGRAPAAGDHPSPGSRKVSLGTVPDFAFPGPGVRLAAVTTGTPAERAGLRAGDVVIGLGGTPVGNLGEFSRALAAHSPGDRVTVRFRREGVEQETSAQVEER
jgi:hypothetical protein